MIMKITVSKFTGCSRSLAWRDVHTFRKEGSGNVAWAGRCRLLCPETARGIANQTRDPAGPYTQARSRDPNRNPHLDFRGSMSHNNWKAETTR